MVSVRSHIPGSEPRKIIEFDCEEERKEERKKERKKGRMKEGKKEKKKKYFQNRNSKSEFRTYKSEHAPCHRKPSIRILRP